MLSSNKKLPEKAMIIPIILLAEVFVLKKNAPVMITKIGVRQFSVPASELSIPSSAKQNKKAGNKLPMAPDMNTMKSLFAGIFRTWLIVMGISTRPADTILKAANWYGLSWFSNPIFIKIKLLPQIMERATKINQLIRFLFTDQRCL